MTQQTMKAQNSIVLVPKLRSATLVGRRLVAWSLEVSLVAMSALVPWGAGHYVLMDRNMLPIEGSVEESFMPPAADSGALRVELNLLVKHAQQGWAWIAQIPPHRLHRTVPRLTNILWTVALIAPVITAGGQLVQLRLTGRTWPKQWLGIQVISITGGSLTLLQVVTRELVRWGLPMVIVVGGTLLTGVSAAPWMLFIVILLAMAEGGTTLALDKRAWHDRVAKTRVTKSHAGYLPISGESLLYSLPMGDYTSSSQSNGIENNGVVGNGMVNSAIQLYGETANDDEWWLTEDAGDLTSLVLPPRSEQSGGSLVLLPPSQLLSGKRAWWLWSSGMVLACLAGFSVGRVGQSSQIQAESDAFLQTAQALMDKTQAEGADYDAAILMLAQVDDPRTAQYLTDLLSQTSRPTTLATVQQALISQGLESLPPLLSLGRVLENDLQQSLDTETRSLRLEQRHMVQGAIAKILTVHSDELDGIRLDRVNLGKYHDSERSFRLIQPGLLAAGTSWQNANLSQANLARASFFDEGPDGKADSYDDIISDLSGINLSGARLEHANLQGAQLSSANFRRADLRDVNLAYGNLEGAQLTNAQLMHVNAPDSQWQGSNLVGADMTQGTLDGADLSRARLNRLEAAHSSWTKAILPQSDWVGANLIGANFEQANLVGADFHGAQLDGVNFERADLRQANLRDADLRQARLTGVNLADADLAGAIFDDGTRVTGSFITPNAQLNTANSLQGVNFSRVRNIDVRQLNYICVQGGIHPSCQKLMDAAE
ncbi:pentapeptide repeat-containing protein [Leptothoe sp. LEGE 181152]|nr:pentapeptide repeat-containing protein [Leptothoe sp. LEGE 181152]